MTIKNAILLTVVNLAAGGIGGSVIACVIFAAMWLVDRAPTREIWVPLIIILSVTTSLAAALPFVISFIKWHRKYGLKW